MTLRTSSEGMTRKTPGIFLAALTSIDLMRPCATVERKILPYSMPGSRIRWVYSARPVTFSRPSRRGTERPIWPPPIGFVGIGNELPLGTYWGSDVTIPCPISSGHLDMNPGRESTILPLTNLHTGVRDGDHL